MHLIGFLDDHSRFLVSCGLHASATTNLVLEVKGPELVEDQGSQVGAGAGLAGTISFGPKPSGGLDSGRPRG